MPQQTDSKTLNVRQALDLDGFAPATAMMQGLRTRQISAVELLDLHLRRIARYNPVLNAIVTPDYDRAHLVAAAAADAARARGEDGELLGLPLTIKDCLYTQGLPTTGGLPATRKCHRRERLAPGGAHPSGRCRDHGQDECAAQGGRLASG